MTLKMHAHLENHGDWYVFISYNVHIKNTPSEAGILDNKVLKDTVFISF